MTYPVAYRRGFQSPRPAPRTPPRTLPGGPRPPRTRPPRVTPWRPAPPIGVPRSSAWGASRYLLPRALGVAGLALAAWQIYEILNDQWKLPPSLIPAGSNWFLSPTATNCGSMLRAGPVQWSAALCTQQVGFAARLEGQVGGPNYYAVADRYYVYQGGPRTIITASPNITGLRGQVWWRYVSEAGQPAPAHNPVDLPLHNRALPLPVLYDPYNPMTLPPGAFAVPLGLAPVRGFDPRPSPEQLPPRESPQHGEPWRPPSVRPTGDPPGDGPREPFRPGWTAPLTDRPATEKEWDFLPDFEWVWDGDPAFGRARAFNPDPWGTVRARPSVRVRPGHQFPQMNGPGHWMPVTNRLRVQVPQTRHKPEPQPQPQRANLRTRPSRNRVRERKVLARRGVGRFIQGLAYFGTELVDWIGALHKALPREYQARRRTPDAMALAIWRHYEHIDVAKAVLWLGYDVLIEDAAIGYLHGKIADFARRSRIQTNQSQGALDDDARWRPQWPME